MTEQAVLAEYELLIHEPTSPSHSMFCLDRYVSDISVFWFGDLNTM